MLSTPISFNDMSSPSSEIPLVFLSCQIRILSNNSSLSSNIPSSLLSYSSSASNPDRANEPFTNTEEVPNNSAPPLIIPSLFKSIANNASFAEIHCVLSRRPLLSSSK